MTAFQVEIKCFYFVKEYSEYRTIWPILYSSRSMRLQLFCTLATITSISSSAANRSSTFGGRAKNKISIILLAIACRRTYCQISVYCLKHFVLISATFRQICISFSLLSVVVSGVVIVSYLCNLL